MPYKPNLFPKVPDLPAASYRHAADVLGGGPLADWLRSIAVVIDTPDVVHMGVDDGTVPFCVAWDRQGRRHQPYTPVIRMVFTGQGMYTPQTNYGLVRDQKLHSNEVWCRECAIAYNEAHGDGKFFAPRQVAPVGLVHIGVSKSVQRKLDAKNVCGPDLGPMSIEFQK